MLRGLYQAGTALEAATANQEVAADNLANVTTPGFRRQGVRFEALLAGASGGPPGAALTPGREPVAYTSFTPGPMQQTGGQFDFALNGDAFFTLEGPNGPVYTRNG